MVKRCQWGLCKSDSRYPERLSDGVKFIPFPKPKRNLEKCKRWIRACGRPHTQLNTSTVDGNYNMYVCSKVWQRFSIFIFNSSVSFERLNIIFNSVKGHVKPIAKL